MNQQLIYKDSEVYPLEMSESGRNAFYIADCDVVGHRPPYAACLHRISLNARKELKDNEDCVRAIQQGTCRALALRREEIKAGHAIHFINRDKLNEWNNERDRAVSARYQELVDSGKIVKRGKPPVDRPVIEPKVSSSSFMSELRSTAPTIKTMPARPVAQPEPGLLDTKIDFAAVINDAAVSVASPKTDAIPKTKSDNTQVAGQVTRPLSMAEIAAKKRLSTV